MGQLRVNWLALDSETGIEQALGFCSSNLQFLQIDWSKDCWSVEFVLFANDQYEVLELMVDNADGAQLDLDVVRLDRDEKLLASRTFRE